MIRKLIAGLDWPVIAAGVGTLVASAGIQHLEQRRDQAAETYDKLTEAIALRRAQLLDEAPLDVDPDLGEKPVDQRGRRSLFLLLGVGAAAAAIVWARSSGWLAGVQDVADANARVRAAREAEEGGQGDPAPTFVDMLDDVGTLVDPDDVARASGFVVFPSGTGRRGAGHPEAEAIGAAEAARIERSGTHAERLGGGQADPDPQDGAE